MTILEHEKCHNDVLKPVGSLVSSDKELFTKQRRAIYLSQANRSSYLLTSLIFLLEEFRTFTAFSWVRRPWSRDTSTFTLTPWLQRYRKASKLPTPRLLRSMSEISANYLDLTQNKWIGWKYVLNWLISGHVYTDMKLTCWQEREKEDDASMMQDAEWADGSVKWTGLSDEVKRRAALALKFAVMDDIEEKKKKGIPHQTLNGIMLHRMNLQRHKLYDSQQKPKECQESKDFSR